MFFVLKLLFKVKIRRLSQIKLQNTCLFINGFIDIVILKNETEGISLNFSRIFTQKIGDKCVENISGHHLK